MYVKICIGDDMNIDRIKEIREDRDITQKEISKVLNIHQQNYSRWELGIVKMPVEKYVELAKFYHVSVDYLLGLTDVMKPYPKSIMQKEMVYANEKE